MRPSDKPLPVIPELTDSREEQWRVIHALAVRGVFQPQTLSDGEVSVISSVALLVLGIDGKKVDAADPQSGQQKH